MLQVATSCSFDVHCLRWIYATFTLHGVQFVIDYCTHFDSYPNRTNTGHTCVFVALGKHQKVAVDSFLEGSRDGR